MHEYFSPLLYTLESVAIPAFYGVLIALLFSAIVRLVSKQEAFLRMFAYYACFGLPVGLIAYTAGMLTGLSRAPAVGSVLPAILALIAGLSVYVFGTESKYKVVVGYCVVVLVFLLVLGIETGAIQREQQHEANLIYLSQREFRIRNFRKNLDLPAEMPNWLFEADTKWADDLSPPRAILHPILPGPTQQWLTRHDAAKFYAPVF
jgi:hypothetical protein